MAGPFSVNPLYRSIGRHIRDEAKREFSRSTVGRLFNEMERARGITNAGRGMLDKLSKLSKQANLRSMLRGSSLGEVVQTVEHYSRSGDRAIVDEFLRDLGPTGQLIRSLVGTSKRSRKQLDRQIDTAIEFLRAFRPEALKQPSRAGKHRKPPTVGDADANIEHMRNALEAAGYQVFAPGEEPKQRTRLPFGIPEKTAGGKPRKRIDIPVGGRTRRFPANHPVVTGDMTETPQSSNVFSYGYDVESEYLYLRFKAPREKGQQKSSKTPHQPGSLYRYSFVPVEKFLKLHAASSKGEWVWDSLRIRGTVSGHRFDYSLVGVTGGYVPRKATLMPDGEWYLRRRVRGLNGETLRSSNPDAIARPLTGAPNRGEPNRGRPNTGAP